MKCVLLYAQLQRTYVQVVPTSSPSLVLHPKIGFSPGQHCRSNVLEMIVCGQVKRKQSRDL